ACTRNLYGSWKAPFLFEMHWDHEPTPSPSKEGSRTAWPGPLPGGVRGGFVADGTNRFMESPLSFFSACIGTMNLTGNSKAPQGRRTPKPGGSSGDLG